MKDSTVHARLRSQLRAFALLAIALTAAPALASEGELPVLVLSGTPEERGYAEGLLCADRIRDLFGGFVLETMLVPVPSLWDRVARPKLLARTAVPDHVRARAGGVIRGMEASGTDGRWIARLERDLVAEDLLAAAALPDFIGLMCSSYATWSTPTPGGAEDREAPPIIGRNLDYLGTPALTRNLMLIVHAPAPGRRGWVSVGWPGFPGCVTGFSDDGVFVAVHDVILRSERDEKATPRLVALQELIEHAEGNAADAARAGAMLRRFQFGMGGNCLLAWRNHAAVLEFDGRTARDDGVTVREPEATPWIVCSNHFLARGDAASRCRRYGRLSERLACPEGRPLDVEAGLALIRLSSKWDTLYRLAANLESGEVLIERRLVPYGEYLEPHAFNFRELLARAGAVASPQAAHPAAPLPHPGGGSRQH